ncbi:hypothetical protein ACROYT_G012696 [Oculina patagonica]
MCCALYYVPKLGMPAWVHVFAIIVNLVIVGCGVLFLGNNDLESGTEDRKKGSSGVKIMVCCLGAVGFTCWMIKAPISGYWAVTANERMDIDAYDPPYFAWVVARFTISAPEKPEKDVKMNHFLVPTVMLAILGAFLETLIDQYVGPLDSRLRCEIKDLSLDILFEAGPPMYLGFLIHMFLHFVIRHHRDGDH